MRKGLWSSCLNEPRHTHAQVRGCAHYFSSADRVFFPFFARSEKFSSFLCRDSFETEIHKNSKANRLDLITGTGILICKNRDASESFYCLNVLWPILFLLGIFLKDSLLLQYLL